MNAIYQYNKIQILKRIHEKWKFKTSPLTHDIPLPAIDKETGERTLSIPLEALTMDEVDQLRQVLRTLSDNVYLKDNQGDMFLIPTDELDIFEEINAIWIDTHLNWVVGVAIMVAENGVSITFGGEALVKQIEKIFHYKNEWISI